MDRTGKRHMARRADDCKPNLEGKPPACSAVIAVLDYGESGHTGAIRLIDRRIFRFLHRRRPDLAPFVVPR
jgi:hypothetical protein